MRRELRNKRIVEILPAYLKRGRALDVGTGSGALAHALQEAGYEVEAVDIDPALCRYPDLTVRQCDVMEGLPYPDGTFDAVTATEVLEHMEDPFKAVREFNRVLRDGGVLVLTTPNYGNIEGRLNYLFAGTLPRALDCRLEAPAAGKAHHHVSPMTVVRLKYLLMTNGFEPVHLSTCIPKRKMLLLAPVAACVYVFVHLFWSAARREKYHIADQMKALFGGRSLVTVSAKRMGK